jgi:hypothetical protein
MKTDTSKSTILVISTGFLILYFIFSWEWTISISLIVGIIGITSSSLSKKIEFFWMKLTRLLELIVPNILLSLIFYFFLFPISAVSKLFRKDPLMLSKKYNSYFININKEINKNTFEKIW